mgnify:CR=1 FL=1
MLGCPKTDITVYHTLTGRFCFEKKGLVGQPKLSIQWPSGQTCTPVSCRQFSPGFSSCSSTWCRKYKRNKSLCAGNLNKSLHFLQSQDYINGFFMRHFLFFVLYPLLFISWGLTRILATPSDYLWCLWTIIEMNLYNL